MSHTIGFIPTVNYRGPRAEEQECPALVVLSDCARCGHKKKEHFNGAGRCSHTKPFSTNCDCSRFIGR